MSMRLQARLLEKLSSHVEESYMRQQDIVVLKNVPAEMVFTASQGFMEHESQKHDYLPCYHMVGKITEIRGDFPFNVSALYFSDVDDQRMLKDIIYYPSPEELAHIIQTGKFYSKHFTVPPILSNNTYRLPCLIDLTIVPPPNQALYEQNSFSNFMELEDEDKVNLPIFYVGVIGTGVSRRNDRLLDYYGIDLEPGYEHFVLTAESSGYTDPPLLQYMDEPVVEEEQQHNVTDEYYITAEEEAQMLHSAAEREQMAEREMTAQVSMDAQADFHEATPEDAVIAQADRAVARRLGEKFNNNRMSLDTLRNKDKQKEQTTESVVEEDPVIASSLKGADVADAQQQTKVDEAHAKDAALDAARQQQEAEITSSDSQKKTPVDPQQQADVKMDLNPEANEYVTSNREDNESHDMPSDRTDVEHMSGADVSDARAQAKIDEAHARDIARDAAVQQQEAHREAPEEMREIAERYDKSRAELEGDSTEFI